MNHSTTPVDRRAGYTRIPNVVVHDTDLSDGAFRLYVILLDHARRSATAFPGRKSLAAAMGVSSLRTVDNRVKELRSSGYLQVTARYRAKGGRTSNSYRLLRVVEDATHTPGRDLSGTVVSGVLHGGDATACAGSVHDLAQEGRRSLRSTPTPNPAARAADTRPSDRPEAGGGGPNQDTRRDGLAVEGGVVTVTAEPQRRSVPAGTDADPDSSPGGGVAGFSSYLAARGKRPDGWTGCSAGLPPADDTVADGGRADEPADDLPVADATPPAAPGTVGASPRADDDVAGAAFPQQVLASLPDQLRPRSRSDQEAARKLLAPLAGTWTARQLVDAVVGVRGLPEYATHPVGLLRARLRELPDPMKPASTWPTWCGTCEERTRAREDDLGRPYRCPQCHPRGHETVGATRHSERGGDRARAAEIRDGAEEAA